MKQSISFVTRVGPVEYAAPFAKAGVSMWALGTNGYKLSMVPDGKGKHYSAGLLGPKMQPGKYEFIVRGLLGAMDPHVDFAIFCYNETGVELDFLETECAEDPNCLFPISLTSWRNSLTGDRQQSVRCSPRKFARLRVQVEITDTLYSVMIEGDQHGTWVTILDDWFHGDLPGELGNLRVSLNLITNKKSNPKGTFFYNDENHGPTSIILESAMYEPW